MAEWTERLIRSDDITEPRTLPCGHTLCRACIQKMTDKANNLRCPLDMKLFKVPGGDAGKLMRNFKLEDAMEIKQTFISIAWKQSKLCFISLQK